MSVSLPSHRPNNFEGEVDIFDSELAESLGSLKPIFRGSVIDKGEYEVRGEIENKSGEEGGSSVISLVVRSRGRRKGREVIITSLEETNHLPKKSRSINQTDFLYSLPVPDSLSHISLIPSSKNCSFPSFSLFRSSSFSHSSFAISHSPSLSPLQAFILAVGLVYIQVPSAKIYPLYDGEDGREEIKGNYKDKPIDEPTLNWKIILTSTLSTLPSTSPILVILALSMIFQLINLPYNSSDYNIPLIGMLSFFQFFSTPHPNYSLKPLLFLVLLSSFLDILFLYLLIPSTSNNSITPLLGVFVVLGTLIFVVVKAWIILG